MKKKVIFVGLSGGVDSAVSAALLNKAGHEVVGVFIKTWHPDFLKCNEEEERRDAMRVAAYLDIPFLTFDLESVYKKEVADYMIREYRAGRTPNPDVMCNKEVKFGAFLKKALAMGADFVATGHYAALRKYSKNSPLYPQVGSDTDSFLLYLLRNKDPSKDQSYFLWTLNQKQLSKIIFPVGNLKKSEVRKLAKKFNLPVAEKKDSQGICFLGTVDLKEFLKHYIKEKRGKVLNTQGEEVGFHDGVVFHTLGERHGFTITKKGPNDSRYYIVSKDIKKNVLVVSQDKNSYTTIYRSSKENIKIQNTNWITEIPNEKKNYTAQIRYHGEFLPCRVKILSKNKAEIIFNKPITVAPGQSIVVYHNNVCLGGGVVS
ncbi:MAG: tRNA 2-thiouridine(34) synthase MnmA [Candidatus Paceibacterota bacterium]